MEVILCLAFLALLLGLLVVPDFSLITYWTPSDVTNVLTNAKLHLFKNNYTPIAGSLLADFTEADFTGYASVTLAGWTTPVIISGKSSTSANPVTFTTGTVGTGNTIYGYYVTDSTNTKLLFAERDANAPIAMNVTGYQYKVTVNFTEKSQ